MKNTLKELCANTIFKQQIDYRNSAIPIDLKQELEESNYINLSADELCKKGCENKEFAFYILNNEKLCEKLGKCNTESLIIAHDKTQAGQADVNSNYIKRISGHYLLGLSNKEVAAYILERSDISAKLGNFQKEELKEFINPPVFSYYTRGFE